MRTLFVSLILTIALALQARAEAVPPEANLDIEERVERLLAEMTLDEKVGQLNLPSFHLPADKQIALARAGKIGGMLNVVNPEHVRDFAQAAAESRLKIPLLLAIDAIYAFRVTFPPPIAWAATWDPLLAEKAAYWVAKDASTVGINWTFAPMADISRDPRWGRVVEGSGEDPYLGAVFAAARVRGYRRGGLATSVKHYVGYGAAEGGRDYNGTQLSVSELHDRYLPPFVAAIKAGSETVMASFNTVNGVPVTMHRGLIRDMLKGRLGFDGIVTSDFVAIGELVNHGVAADRQVAARQALLAGIDLDMASNAYARFVKIEVEAGRIPPGLVDDAVRRVLRVKFRMGLFEKPLSDYDQLPVPMDMREMREAARLVARDSFVLLKNDGHYLPISKSVETIALIGAAADTTKGDHTWSSPAGYETPQAQTLQSAMRERLAPGQTLTYVPAFTGRCGQHYASKDDAVAAAQRADLIVYVVSEDCLQLGEGVSRTKLGLSGVQQDLLEALVKTGRPLVLIVETGRPLTLTYADTYAQAILVAWHPGTEGRTALSEVLFGEHAPSGRLPMTFPRSVGQIPLSYDSLPTSRPHTGDRYTTGYVDEAISPLYPFGHGLTYTAFQYQNIRISKTTLPADGTITVEIDVKNIGERTGQEVVQLYTRQLVASRSRPMRQLKRFQKVEIAPRETKTVRFDLAAYELGYHDDAGKLILENAPFELYAGGDANADLRAKFTVTGAPGADLSQ